ncbi:MAG TPA: hypothetical protein PKC28_13320 [Bdellovibrionales bacterium]|nr:hypothetical protein [Bdellovibrionales bacterium]
MLYVIAIFLLFFGPVDYAVAEPLPPKVQYTKLQVSKERFNQTWTVLGRVQPSKIEILQKNFELKTIPLKGQVRPEDLKPTEVKATPTNLDVPSLNFIMKAQQTKQCENLREFRTFLNQLDTFKGLFVEMEITASSRRDALCVSRMAELIIAKEFKVNVAFGSLPDAGIVVRAYIDSKRRAGELASVGGVRIVAALGTMRKSLVTVLKDGYFIMSFDQDQQPTKLTFEYEGKILHEETLEGLPQWTLGDFEKPLFGTQSGTVQKGNIDSLSVEDIPDSVLERAVQEKLAYQNKYRWSIRNNVRARTVSGSGLTKSEFQEIVPVSLDAQYSVTDRFNLKVDLTPQLFLGDADAPKTNHIAAGLLYWIFGHENRHFLERAKVRFGMGVQGYYLQNRATKATRESAFLLTDLMGVALINRLSYQPSAHWSFGVGYDLMPFPESQANRNSLSTRQMADAEYCFSYTSCVSVGYGLEAFELDYVTIGKLTFETADWTVGYRMAFE